LHALTPLLQMQKHFPVILILFSVLTSLPAVCHAQEKMDTDSLSVVKLFEVIVKGNSTQFSKEKTSSIDSEHLTREKIDLLQYQTLGATLSHLPGVQNSYFGPNSGTPTIRSMSGNRVKILSNGLEINNLSGISPNININVDSENLLSIDVYKGEAGVLFGGKAIGGAVNLQDNTIPEAQFKKQLEGYGVVEGGSNSGYRQAVTINGNLGKNLAWYIGGMNRWNGDLKIPGNTKAPIAYDKNIDDLTQSLAQVNVDAENIRNLSLYPYISQYVLDKLDDPKLGLTEDDLYTFKEYSYINGQDIRNPVNDLFIPNQDPDTPLYEKVVHGISDYAPVTKGIMPNSHSKSKSLNIGTNYSRDNLSVGIGYRYIEGFYGIPGFALTNRPTHSHDHGHNHDHGAVSSSEYAPINTASISSSILFESELQAKESYFSSFRLNYTFQYSVDRELIGEFLGNKFDSNRQAFRIEAQQKPWKFGSGMSGIDYSFLKMNGKGAQRYLPNNQSQEFGVFTLQELKFRSLLMNLGYRHDWIARKALPDPTYKPGRGLAGGNLSARYFDLNHFTAGIRWDFFKSAFLKASFNHGERAPNVNELYAGNDHFAIMIEENGDDQLNKEIANTYEYGLGLNYKGLNWSITNYHTTFNNYLYLAHTGIARSGGFLVKEWRGSDTEISGWETTLNYQRSLGNKSSLELSTFFDLVKSKNVSDDPLRKWAEGDYMPNLPTSRYSISSTFTYHKLLFHTLFERYLKQKYLGKNINPEPAMPAYSLLSARIGYPLKIFLQEIDVYVSGDNILNIEARPQNSYLKYLAPLPGRNITLGLKLTL